MNNATIDAMLKAIGMAPRTLALTAGTWKIGKSLTIPAHVHLQLEYGTVLEVAAGQTLTIDGPMAASGLNTIFTGKGKVHFGAGYIGEVYPQWWGKIGGMDDTATCQAALDSGAATIRFPRATYAVDAVGAGGGKESGLRPASRTTLRFDPGALLQAIATDKDEYYVLNIAGKRGVRVEGATIRGERNEHKGKGGEWGHGISITQESTDIKISDVKVSDCWGDGIYLGGGCVDGILVENSSFDNNRRNACSITNARNVLFKNCVFSNSNGTGPYKGVDVEANKPADVIQNIVFDTCRSFKNLSGGFSVARDDAQDLPVTVTFRNCTSLQDGMGFGMDIGPSDCPGLYTITDCTVIDAGENGFRSTSANLQTRIDGLYIVNPNRKGETRPQFASAFALWNAVPQHAGKKKLAGNIEARNVFVQSTDDKTLYALYTDNELGEASGFINLDIQIKTNLPAEKRFFKGRGPYLGYCKIDFPDEPVVNAPQGLAAASMPAYAGQKITNVGATGDTMFDLTDARAASFDSVYTFEVVDPHKVTVKTGLSLLPSGASLCSSSQIGSRLKIKSNGQNWMIVEQVGSWKFGE